MVEQIKKFFESATRRYQLFLILIGTIVFGTHFLVLGHPRLALGLESIGLSIIITTLVTTASFEEKLHSSFQIIQGTTASKTENIFPNRPKAVKAINDRVKEIKKTIDILAIAGTDFFGMGCGVINELDERFRCKVNIHARVLLLDPRSYYAVERSLLEEKKTADEMMADLV